MRKLQFQQLMLFVEHFKRFLIILAENNTLRHMATDYPKDPAMLISWANLKLRDFYGSLDELCEDLEIDRKEIEDRLAKAGFEYNAELNKFW